MAEWTEKYGGYWLKCTPYPAPGGKFAPNLVIERHESGRVDVRTDVRVVGGPAYYGTEKAAANAARIAGRKWVDDHGLSPTGDQV